MSLRVVANRRKAEICLCPRGLRVNEGFFKIEITVFESPFVGQLNEQ